MNIKYIFAAIEKLKLVLWQENKYKCFGCKQWYVHQDVCPSNDTIDYLYCKNCYPYKNG